VGIERMLSIIFITPIFVINPFSWNVYLLLDTTIDNKTQTV